MLIERNQRRRLPRFKGWGVLSAMLNIMLVVVVVRACGNAQEANKSAEIAVKQVQEASKIAGVAVEQGKEANKIAATVLNRSNQLDVINAEVQLNQLLNYYCEIDDQLKFWEQSLQLIRDKNKDKPAKTREELESQLGGFQAPENIKLLYLQRFERYQNLLDISKRYEPFKDRLPSVTTALPLPPRLPAANMPEGDTMNGIMK